MRNSTRTELRTLREVAHFLLPLICCEFCGKPLLDPKLADTIFGDKAHSPLKNLKLTIHHRNGKHRDNYSAPLLFSNSVFQKWMPLKHVYDGAKKLEIVVSKDGKLFAICGNKSLVHRPCHSQHEMKENHHKRKVMKVKPLREKAKDIIDKLCKSKYYFVGVEEKFLNKMIYKHFQDEKFTRYEIRRLKKLAAKVEKK